MAELVYLLCAATSIMCAVLLMRAYGQSRAKLLFWSGLCFIGLAANNVLLFIDLVVVPTAVDLSVLRNSVGVGALAVLLFGLVWESQ
jgi:multidrug transporter EmrE-like cation transporter